MSDAREHILARVRAALAAAHAAPVAHPGAYRPGSGVPPSRLERFIAQVRASGAEVVDAADHTPLAGTARVRGTLGVAESGAIWVTPSSAIDQQRLFLTEHLTLVVSVGSLVETLHDAYAVLEIASAPYGCFIAGPSKTADIEQTLVIGAQGPLGLTVELIP